MTRDIGVPHFKNNFVEITKKWSQNEMKVLIRFTGSPIDTEMKEYLEFVDDVYARNLPFAMIYDASEIGLLSFNRIRDQADFMRKKDALTRKLVRKCAIVLTNAFAIKTLELLFRMKPAACPYAIVDTMDKAKIYMRT